MKPKALGFWIRIAFLFLIRSGRATTALAIMVIVAVSALIFLSALAVGVNDAMLRNTVGLFAGHITGSKLPAAVGVNDLETRGVESILKRVYIPGILTNGSLGKPLMVCAIDPQREMTVTALHKKIIAGRYPQNGRPELMVSKPIAEELGTRIGATLHFKQSDQDTSRMLTVSGIYQTHIDLLDRGIAFCPAGLFPAEQTPWSAAIFLENGVRTEEILKQYQQKWPVTGRFESWETMMPDLRQLIDLEYISMGIVIILVFGVVAIGIACSFIIFIIKNMREYGIMKAMGVTVGEMSLLIVMKVALMNILACGAGLLIGGTAVWGVAGSGGIDITAFTSHNQYFTVSGVIYPRLTPFSLLAPPVISFLFSLIAAIWPVVLVVRKKTADIMRMV